MIDEKKTLAPNTVGLGNAASFAAATSLGQLIGIKLGRWLQSQASHLAALYKSVKYTCKSRPFLLESWDKIVCLSNTVF